MTEEPAKPIVLKDIHAGYPGHEVLRGIDLEIRSGERVVLLAPNGAGKTTLLRVILGLLKPSRGDASTWGAIPSDPIQRPRLLARVGANLEAPLLLPRATSLEWLRNAAELAGIESPGETARSLLLHWDVPATTEIEKLSQGQRQKLQTAGTLLHRPALLVLDEPAAHLDPTAREQYRAHLSEYLELTGATSILSTHQLEDAAEHGNRWVVMGGGRILYDGTPEAFLERHPCSRSLVLDGDVPFQELSGLLAREFPGISVQSSPAGHGHFRIRSPDGPGIHARLVECLVAQGIGVRSLGDDATTWREAYSACQGPSDTDRTATRRDFPAPGRSVGKLAVWKASASLHLTGLRREKRLLVPFGILLLPPVTTAILLLPHGSPARVTDGILALAATLPCGLVAGIASDLVAGERERRNLETLLCQSVPFRSILFGRAIGVGIGGTFVSWGSAAVTAAALHSMDSSPDPRTLLVLALGYCPAVVAVSVATGAWISARSKTLRSAAQFASLASFPLIAVAQVLLWTLPGPWISWISVTLLFLLAATLLGRRTARNIQPERLFR